MYPVFSGVSNKILLASSRGTVALNGRSFGTDQIVEFGELDDKRIVIIFEERLGFESCSEDGLEVPARLFLLSVSPQYPRHDLKSGKLTSCFLMIFWNPV